jgi:hypothetical protein
MIPLRILSLGAGVQSSATLLMSIANELDRLDAAIFSDTGWEPRAVYDRLAKLEAVAAEAGIPVFRVAAGNLRNDALNPGHRFASMPLHVRDPKGDKGMIRRQCTREYKLDPIRRKVQEVHEAAGRRPVEQWMGISLDEISRMRTSDVRYITNRYPLVDRRMTRHDCRRWLDAHGWPEVPKSSCIGCPYHSDRQWRQLRDTCTCGHGRDLHDHPVGCGCPFDGRFAHPCHGHVERLDGETICPCPGFENAEWADAVEFDQAIRGGHRGSINKVELQGQAFLHPSLVPLDQVDLSTPEDRGQLNLFEDDCQSGVCGL